jgi:N-acetyl-alpha-D-muramate 1-phosphate uridylyltransferase
MADQRPDRIQVAIIAGGMGTRLGTRTSRRPKALIPVRGRPFLDHQLELMAGRGVTDVVVCVGHGGAQIERFVGDGRRWGLNVLCSRDGPFLLGTAGALRQALPLLAPSFAVAYGDSYVTMDYTALQQAHVASGRAATVAVYENADRWDRSNIVLQGDRVAVYDKHHHRPGMTWIDAGVTALDRRWIAALPAGRPLDLAEQFNVLAQAGELGAHPIDERFYEVGSVAGLAEFRRLLAARARTSRPGRG